MAAEVPGQLVWEMVRKNNCFLVKQFGRGNAKVQFTKEPNNLYNIHSYRLGQPKAVAIKPTGSKDEVAVVVSLSKPKAINIPTPSQCNTLMKKLKKVKKY